LEKFLVQTMKVALWSIDKPIPYPKNARKITDVAIAKVASSIRSYGWQQPIVVDREGVIIVGHTRLLAAKQLGLTQVPVLVAADLTPQQVKAYRLMDNRSHETTLWDIEKLGDELLELKSEDFDLALTGFDNFEFESLLPETSGAPRRLYQTQVVSLDELKQHPRNYRSHPEDQLAHIVQSIQEHGFYRNIVMARDHTVLAGHGLVEACRKMGRTHIQVVSLDIAPDSIEALKIMAGDNDIQNRGEVNDRLLTEILKDIREQDTLLGSGYDDMMLANLLYVTRPSSEIKDGDAVAEWVGMPEYDPGKKPLMLRIAFRNQEDRERFVQETGIDIRTRGDKLLTWSTWWPFRKNDDIVSVRFETAPQQQEVAQ
jgi:ParB-like chromosome segregation protein Spo0J